MLLHNTDEGKTERLLAKTLGKNMVLLCPMQMQDGEKITWIHTNFKSTLYKHYSGTLLGKQDFVI